jgi:hypothetical protein
MPGIMAHWKEAMGKTITIKVNNGFDSLLIQVCAQNACQRFGAPNKSTQDPCPPNEIDGESLAIRFYLFIHSLFETQQSDYDQGGWLWNVMRRTILIDELTEFLTKMSSQDVCKRHQRSMYKAVLAEMCLDSYAEYSIDH